jgi:predicted deacylase
MLSRYERFIGAIVIIILNLSFSHKMFHKSTVVNLPKSNIGQQNSIIFHRFGIEGLQKVYIQASLHADELPGLLVCHHLIHLLEEAASKGLVDNSEIIIVPFANPIGLSQNILGLN